MKRFGNLFGMGHLSEAKQGPWVLILSHMLRA